MTVDRRLTNHEIGLRGTFAVASGGLGYAGYGLGALAVGMAGDTIFDTAILDDSGLR